MEITLADIMNAIENEQTRRKRAEELIVMLFSAYQNRKKKTFDKEMQKCTLTIELTNSVLNEFCRMGMSLQDK